MSKHLVIIGAGPGLSLVNARKFGANDYAVTLVGRTPERLEGLRSTLAGEGITASTHVADVTDHDGLRAALREIDGASAIDVCIFQPSGRAAQSVDVLAATVENVRPNLELLTLGAVAVGEVLIPAMTARGTGTVIFVGGGSARLPLRFFGNLGQAMAGLRFYALTLNKALRGTGVFSAFFTVAGMILTEGPPSDQEIRATDLADRIWRLAQEQEPAEVLVTPGGEFPLT